MFNNFLIIAWFLGKIQRILNYSCANAACAADGWERSGSRQIGALVDAVIILKLAMLSKNGHMKLVVTDTLRHLTADRGVGKVREKS